MSVSHPQYSDMGLYPRPLDRGQSAHSGAVSQGSFYFPTFLFISVVCTERREFPLQGRERRHHGKQGRPDWHHGLVEKGQRSRCGSAPGNPESPGERGLTCYTQETSHLDQMTNRLFRTSCDESHAAKWFMSWIRHISVCRCAEAEEKPCWRKPSAIMYANVAFRH